MTQQQSEDWVAACIEACSGMAEEELLEFSGGTLKHYLADTDELLKAVCVALLDVDYLGRCEQGIYALKKQNAEMLAVLEDIAQMDTALNDCATDGVIGVVRQTLAKFRNVK